jgi:stress response protein YsnF
MSAKRETDEAPRRGHIAVIEERLGIHTTLTPAARIRVRRRTERRVATVPLELARDEFVCERVAIDRTVDAVPLPRVEGDIVIVPRCEEVLVVERRIVLREELRFSRKRVLRPVVVRGALRSDRIEVHRTPLEGRAGAPDVVGTGADIDAGGEERK